ncbi:hypothetical protein ENSA5_44730 [Enhygromyxa salina]|uniref:Uncharacterized protein n=1 Tax=Enhygromyxa salina TaxID=215803 RepID=A0A2S9XJY1_9BACT|nr:hypothetical protein ENSA5_44730 [Enhygromyxa salina]
MDLAGDRGCPLADDLARERDEFFRADRVRAGLGSSRSQARVLVVARREPRRSRQHHCLRVQARGPRGCGPRRARGATAPGPDECASAALPQAHQIQQRHALREGRLAVRGGPRLRRARRHAWRAARGLADRRPGLAHATRHVLDEPPGFRAAHASAVSACVDVLPFCRGARARAVPGRVDGLHPRRGPGAHAADRGDPAQLSARRADAALRERAAADARVGVQRGRHRSVAARDRRSDDAAKPARGDRRAAASARGSRRRGLAWRGHRASWQLVLQAWPRRWSLRSARRVALAAREPGHGGDPADGPRRRRPQGSGQLRRACAWFFSADRAGGLGQLSGVHVGAQRRLARSASAADRPVRRRVSRSTARSRPRLRLVSEQGRGGVREPAGRAKPRG